MEKEREETSMCGCLSIAPTGDMADNPVMCPDWKSNHRPFSLQAGIQSSEAPAPLFLSMKFVR